MLFSRGMKILWQKLVTGQQIASLPSRMGLLGLKVKPTASTRETQRTQSQSPRSDCLHLLRTGGQNSPLQKRKTTKMS
jgi:hypothetical protein